MTIDEFIIECKFENISNNCCKMKKCHLGKKVNIKWCNLFILAPWQLHIMTHPHAHPNVLVSIIP
jgi:hypothetical protein